MYTDQLLSPSNVSLIEATPGHLVFSWTSVTHECSAITYIFDATNCGVCPTATNTTTATCSTPVLQSNDARICTVSVRAVVCNDVEGEQSNLATIRLKGIVIYV